MFSNELSQGDKQTFGIYNETIEITVIALTFNVNVLAQKPAQVKIKWVSNETCELAVQSTLSQTWG